MMTMYRRTNDHPRPLHGALLRLLLLLLLSLPWAATMSTARAAASGDLLSAVPVVNENALNNAACGVAAAAMVLDYYRQQANPGATPLDLKTVVQYVQQYSRLGKVVGTATWKTTDQAQWFAALQGELDQKRPLILYLADGHTVWPAQHWHYGHYIVVSGYTADQSIIYHDPWEGQAHTLSNADFGRAWGTTWGNNPAWWYLTIVPSILTPLGPPPLASLPAGYITTYAGGLTGAHGPPTSFSIQPEGVIADNRGHLLISDPSHMVVWLLNMTDLPTRLYGQAIGAKQMAIVAGNASPSFSGDGGPAVDAALFDPSGLAVDAAGKLFIADTGNNRVREVAAGSGIITTVAGNGHFELAYGGMEVIGSFSGDGGPATQAGLRAPSGVALDSLDNLYIADSASNRVRKVNLHTGTISTVAGNGRSTYSGDGGPAVQAGLNDPTAVAVDRAGNLFIADSNNERVRRVLAESGVITTVAGGGNPPQGLGDGGLATHAALSGVSNLAVDSAGNLFIDDYAAAVLQDNLIREVHASNQFMTAVAGGGNPPDGIGDGGPAAHAQLRCECGVSVDSAGNLFIADQENGRIREVHATTGIITTVAGNGADSFYNGADSFYSGNGGPAIRARLSPGGVAVDRAGDLLVADPDNNRILTVSAGNGTITSVAGNAAPINDIRTAFSGDGGFATRAGMLKPSDVVADTNGNLFIADTGDNRIRKVYAGSGIIRTIAGKGSDSSGDGSYSGDGGPAIHAGLNNPEGVAVDSAGNIFIADTENYRVREVHAGTGIITTVAGNGTSGYGGDGGPATKAELRAPTGLTVDSRGDLFIADSGDNRIREVAAGSGIITTVAGNGIRYYVANSISMGTFSGDGGPATLAGLSEPSDVAVDSAGDLFIADTVNQRIREVQAGTGIITTVVGNGSARLLGYGGYPVLGSYGPVLGSYGGDGGKAIEAGLDSPTSVALDAAGNLSPAGQTGTSGSLRRMRTRLGGSPRLALSPNSRFLSLILQ